MNYLGPILIKAIIYNKIHKNRAFPLKYSTVNEIEQMLLDDLISFISLDVVYFIKGEYTYDITGDEKEKLIALDEYHAKLIFNNDKFTKNEILPDNFDSFWKIIKNYIYLEFDNKKIHLLHDYISKYIDEFENNSLHSVVNYYSFEKHLSVIPYIFQGYYEKFGKRFTITEKMDTFFSGNQVEKIGEDVKVRHFKELKNVFRIFEILLYLEKKKYIKLLDCSFGSSSYLNFDKVINNEDKYSFNISILFFKSPSEIYDIERYWSYYGDIRVNKKDGVAYYKNSRYPFKSTKGRAFKLLCFLVKNHGKKIPVDKAYRAIIKEDDLGKIDNKFKYMKNFIKDYVKEIKKNLKISKDKNPSIDIMVIKDSVMLISNPPIK